MPVLANKRFSKVKQALILYSVVSLLFTSDRELKIIFVEYIFWESNAQKSTYRQTRSKISKLKKNLD